MVDMLHLFSNISNLPYSYSLQNRSSEYLASLNSGDTHVQISSYTIKESRYSRIEFGYPFKSSQDFIFTKLPQIQVLSKLRNLQCIIHIGVLSV